MAPATTQALATFDPAAYPVLVEGPGAITELIEANLDPGENLSPFDLPRAKVPGGGSLSFQIGDEEAKTLSGVIIFKKRVRTYWKESLDDSGGGTPPDCFSPDLIHGIGDPGVLCETCANAQFGSALKGPGQACKQQSLLFFLRENEALPTLVTVPPSSLKALKGYLLGLVSKRKKMFEVVTELSLERAKNAGGIDYARIKARAVADLDPEQVAAVETFAKAMRPHLERVNPPEVAEGGVDLGVEDEDLA